MTPERWRRLNEIFQSAFEQPTATRDAFLKHACAGDASLERRVAQMLREHEQATGLLDSPPWRQPEQFHRFHPDQLVADRYRIVRFVAKGGMGEVYEARDVELNDQVALKTLLPEIAAIEQMVLRFKREIQLSRKIAHPNVCKMYDITRHPAGAPSPSQIICLTMEFLAGETLQQVLERSGPMAAPQALRILTHVADALEAAHLAGVIHRDLKTSNIMLVPAMDGGVRAVVTDFGLARRLTRAEGEGRITETGKLLGTWDYMAPELLAGQEHSTASDIYSLGILGYVLTTGHRPFPHESPIAALIRRSQESVPPPSSLAPELEPHWDRAILGCLAADPSQRYQRPSEFATALINWKE